MNVIHGNWIPNDTDGFIKSGGFYLWVETDEDQLQKDKSAHPRHLPDKACFDFLKDELAVSSLTIGQGTKMTLSLPTLEEKPLPAPELQSVDVNDTVTLQNWQVTAYPLPKPLKTINNIHFLSCYQVGNCRIGSDFLFWYYFSQSLKHMLVKDQYLPLLVARQTDNSIELFRRWQIVSGSYEQLIQSAVCQMPLACSQHYQPESLLRHFAEVTIHELLADAVLELPQVFTKRVQDDLLGTILLHKPTSSPVLSRLQLPTEFRHWLQWQRQLIGTEVKSALQLGFQLYEADAEAVDQWRLVFFLSSHQDPSLKIVLADYWLDNGPYQGTLQQSFGPSLDQQVLVNLAQAARIYPKLWQGMDGSEPNSVQLDLDEAFDFLKESAWILEDASFKVIIPAWLTPKGRRRAKIRLRSGGKRPSKSASTQSYFSLETVTDYRYELAIGDESLTPEEWRQLVASKAPLVHFRGQWMELDRDKMQEMLSFMQQQSDTVPDLSIQELLKKLAEEESSFELDVNDNLAQMLAKLSDNSQLEPIATPEKLNAELREYQKRGVSWLRYLEN